MYTDTQLPRLLGSVLKVCGWLVGGLGRQETDRLCSSTKLLVELIWVVTISVAFMHENLNYSQRQVLVLKTIFNVNFVLTFFDLVIE